LTDKMRCSNGR